MSDKPLQTILLVDDEDGILKSLGRLLKQLEVNIVTARSGPEALELLKSQPVALVISDQRMPGMTGVEMLQRSREIAPDAVRILLTGYADIDTTVEAINSGAIRYYFNKPWDDEYLVSRITESLNLQRMIVENKRLDKLTRQQNDKLKKLNNSLEQKVAEQTREIRQRNEELNRSFMETIKAFSTIIGLRFKEVGSHSQRVAMLAEKMCRGFELNQKEFQDIVIAAYLHDIGKVGISDNVLKKNANDYKKADLDAINKHPILGQTCIYGISGFEEIGVIIRHHHEDYNGGGYPDNLREKRIPLGSRIIRLADTFDHQAFEKGYPNITTLNEATAYLVQYSGSQFDPDLVKKFVEMDVARSFLQKESSETIVIKPFELEVGMVIASDIHTNSGMFLLPKGARLSSGIIKRIIKIDKLDPIPGGVCVHKQVKSEGVEYAAI